MTPETLGRAAAIAANALESLPETPVTAAGVNIRYQFEEIPDELIEDLASGLDDRLLNADTGAVAKFLRRTVPWQDGVINIEVHENQDSTGLILFNFHRQSGNSEELRAWFDLVQDMAARAQELVTGTFRVTLQEELDEEQHT